MYIVGCQSFRVSDPRLRLNLVGLTHFLETQMAMGRGATQGTRDQSVVRRPVQSVETAVASNHSRVTT